MATELEALIAQKKAIEKRIRELSNPKYDVDGAKLFVRGYQGRTRKDWVVTLEEFNNVKYERMGYNRQIVVADTKEKALEYIQLHIATLVNLYNAASDSVHIGLSVRPKPDAESKE